MFTLEMLGQEQVIFNLLRECTVTHNSEKLTLLVQHFRQQVSLEDHPRLDLPATAHQIQVKPIAWPGSFLSRAWKLRASPGSRTCELQKGPVDHPSSRTPSPAPAERSRPHSCTATDSHSPDAATAPSQPERLGQGRSAGRWVRRRADR